MTAVGGSQGGSYPEANSAQPGISSSLAVENWPWNATILGKMLWELGKNRVDHLGPYSQYLAQLSLISDWQIRFKRAPLFSLTNKVAFLQMGFH